ncbi:MAG: hypothetical protein HY053_03410 [Proteobacteria bacterium]|nr:hypothetical protein [Pseudomonadota bacterium]
MKSEDLVYCGVHRHIDGPREIGRYGLIAPFKGLNGKEGFNMGLGDLKEAKKSGFQHPDLDRAIADMERHFAATRGLPKPEAEAYVKENVPGDEKCSSALSNLAPIQGQKQASSSKPNTLKMSV